MTFASESERDLTSHVPLIATQGARISAKSKYKFISSPKGLFVSLKLKLFKILDQVRREKISRDLRFKRIGLRSLLILPGRRNKTKLTWDEDFIQREDERERKPSNAVFSIRKDTHINLIAAHRETFDENSPQRRYQHARTRGQESFRTNFRYSSLFSGKYFPRKVSARLASRSFVEVQNLSEDVDGCEEKEEQLAATYLPRNLKKDQGERQKSNSTSKSSFGSSIDERKRSKDDSFDDDNIDVYGILKSNRKEALKKPMQKPPSSIQIDQILMSAATLKRRQEQKKQIARSNIAKVGNRKPMLQPLMKEINAV